MAPSEDRLPAVRRRGAELEATLLDAAWDELLDVGYARLTMEGVAARAHTGKQVLYRRWPNRSQLMAAAGRRKLGPLVPQVPDTGSLREDVLAVLRLMVRRLHQAPVDLLLGLSMERVDLSPQMFDPLLDVMTTVLGHAVARGELTHADLSPRVASLPLDLARYEGLRFGPERLRQATDQDLEAMAVEIVDDVFLPLVYALAGKRPAGDPDIH